MEEVLHGRALAWGGSIGIRISRAEADRLGIRPGQELDLKLLKPDDRLDTSHFRTFHDREASLENLDRLWGEGISRSMGLTPRDTPE